MGRHHFGTDRDLDVRIGGVQLKKPRQDLIAFTAALSRIEFPMLWAMVASVTLPLPGSTVTTKTPLPVIFRLRASYGSSGRGALMALAFACEVVIIPGSLGGPTT